MNESPAIAETKASAAAPPQPQPRWKKHWRVGVVVVAIALAFAFLKPTSDDARKRALATMSESYVSLNLNADGTLDSAEFRNKPALDSPQGNLSWAFDQLRWFPEVKAVSTQYLMAVNVATLRDLSNLESFRVTERAEFADEDFAVFAAMKNLHSLELRGDKVNARAIELLAGAPKLKTLRLSGAQWGEGLTNIARMPSLETLSLEGSARLSKEPLRLAAPKRLKSLRVMNLAATPEDLEGLETLQSLEELYFMIVNLQPVHFERIRKLPKLKVLKISGGAGRSLEDSASIVAAMPSLETLAFADYRGDDQTQWLTPRALRKIAESKTIREIEVYNAQIGDEGVRILASMPNLKVLVLSQVGASEDCFDAIRSMKSLQQLELYEPQWAKRRGISQAKLLSLRESLALKKIEMSPLGRRGGW